MPSLPKPSRRDCTPSAFLACCPARPLDHLKGAGLVWRISGGKITEMHTDWAAIEVNGERHVFHRRPAPVNFLLPWRRLAL